MRVRAVGAIGHDVGIVILNARRPDAAVFAGARGNLLDLELQRVERFFNDDGVEVALVGDARFLRERNDALDSERRAVGDGRTAERKCDCAARAPKLASSGRI